MRMKNTLQVKEIADLLNSATDEAEEGKRERKESDDIKVVESSFTSEPKSTKPVSREAEETEQIVEPVEAEITP